MTNEPLDRARSAKDRLRETLIGDDRIVGIGIGGNGGQGYVVKVNLAVPEAGDVVPSAVDGVPVITQVVGHIRPLQP